jgi:acetaldehyde dehydrogenase (acetylating)
MIHLYRIRNWISIELIILGIKLAPDERARGWLRFGMLTASEGIMNDLQQPED